MDPRYSEDDLFAGVFGEHAVEVRQALERHRTVWAKLPPERRRVSDVVNGERDGAGNEIQFVDLVMEGGGVLGLALVGFTYALEALGIRFLRIAGTSAGAINAMAVAAVAAPGRASGPEVLQELGGLDLSSFVDGRPLARRLVRVLGSGARFPLLLWLAAIAGVGIAVLLPVALVVSLLLGLAVPPPLRWALLAAFATVAVATFWIARDVLSPLRRRRGLHPGRAFLGWMTDLLERHGIRTVDDLAKRMQPSEVLRVRHERLQEDREAGRAPSEDPVVVGAFPLKLVAADLTTESKIVFPAMAELYYPTPGEVNPARFVRASMAVPGFFEPVVIEGLPQRAAAWATHTGYSGAIPRRAVLVDGGVMSNFPIDLFHSTSVPRCPTFGVKLGVDRAEPRLIRTLRTLAGSLFEAARHTADYDFLFRNPDYRQVVSFVPTQGLRWLDFGLDAAARADLFCRGVATATAFLERFDWAGYKKLRGRLAQAHAAAG